MNIYKELKEEVLLNQLQDTLIPKLHNVQSLIEDYYYLINDSNKNANLSEISSELNNIISIFEDLSYNYIPENVPDEDEDIFINILLKYKDDISNFISNFAEKYFESFVTQTRYILNLIDVHRTSLIDEGEEILTESFINEAIEVHNKLNPKLWNGTYIKPEVLDKLREIANEFINYIEIPIDVIDIEFVGSNASYNYNDKSDIDLHIITNFEMNYIDDTILQQLYNSKKSSFNDTYDLYINDIPVELYIEDVKSNNASLGVYSILQNKWIKTPEPQNYDIPDISKELNNINSEIYLILKSNNPNKIKEEINKIYLMRKRGLSKEGESSIENLVFKELRNQNKIQELKDKYYELKSKELSL